MPVVGKTVAANPAAIAAVTAAAVAYRLETVVAGHQTLVVDPAQS